MGEILRSWIQARLGVLIDLRPEAFGHYTKDGTLLAQILHSYDIISRDQVETIVQTQDPALCRVNLKHLRFWLRFLGIDFEKESIDEISCGKGATSLRLFYKLYLCLESKDRLHFITLQKEREKYVPASKKFEVTPVNEDPSPYQPADHPLCGKLVKGKVEWHRFNFPSLLRKLKRKREKEEEPAWKPYSVVKPVEQRAIEDSKESLEEKRKRESEELDRFARKHRVRRKSVEEEKEGEEKEEESGRFTEDPEAAKAYVNRVKSKARCAAITAALVSRIQKTLLWELLERTNKEQEEEFDRAIARRTLDQSRYEKQMVTRLCEAREQKNAMVENRSMVENMTLKAQELERRADLELQKDVACKKEKDAETECERMCELRLRLFEEKVRRIRAKHQKICRQTVEDLVRLALNIGMYRRANEGDVPFSLLCEWKTMFLERRPIVDERFSWTRVQREKMDQESKELEETEETEEMEEKVDTQEILEGAIARRELAFESYLESNPPWDEFTPILGEEEREIFELGRVVLGYVVHRLLNTLYPRPPNRAHVLLSKFKNAAIVLGIANSELHGSLAALLRKSSVRLVRLEDAINYCLHCYKDEMADYQFIDANIIAATNEALIKRAKQRSTVLETRYLREERRTKSGSSRSERSRQKLDERSSNAQDKQTQTPRNIPFDDLHPVLTDSAFIGKWVYEYLTLGEPINDELATKVLLQYLNSLTDAKGWALIDYPNTYDQMCLLERTLTGFCPPPDAKPLTFHDATIEQIDPSKPRIVFEDQEDPFASKRRSRLVPDPIANRDEIVMRSTFVTLFVRVAAKPKTFREDRLYEPVGDDAPSIDRFYAAQKIAYVLYYSTLDGIVLKRLARLLIGEPLQRKPSNELFGDALKALGPNATQPAMGSRAPVVRRFVLETFSVETESEEDLGRDIGEPSVDTRDSIRGIDSFQPDWLFESRPAKPGEPTWRWIDLPLSSDLQQTLANLWEHSENAYVENIREMLFLKSLRVSSVVPYRDFVTRNTREFIKRPDNKQNLLNHFHKAFNAIDPDARHDLEVKCELHRRVADFQVTLWDICDQRKREAEEERKRLIADHWAVFEISVLYNVYVGIVQAELDRSLDTMRLVEDYYLSMLKKPLASSSIANPVLNRIETDGDETAIRFEVRFETEPQTDRTDRKKERSERKGKTDVLPPAVDAIVLRKQIEQAFLDKNNSFREAEDCCAFASLSEAIRYAKSVVEGKFANANEIIRRERATLTKLAKELPAGSGSGDSIFYIASRGEDLVSEWRYALEYEITRVRLKLDSVLGVARVDFFFVLNTLQRTFHEIYDAIVDRYWRETRSVKEMGIVFCFAIEEGRMIVNEMLLEGDTFVVRSNVFVTEVDLGAKRTVVKEASSGSRFRVTDLARLTEIFRRVAPSGTMSERAFVYILQDLVNHGREEGESMLLPCSWYRLKNGDVSKLVSYLFESVDYVDWREFVVYAMELPLPTQRELLIARDRFRAQDPDLRETVTRSQYHRTPLWFIGSSMDDSEVYDLLCEDFQMNAEQLYEEELYRATTVLDESSNSEETLRRLLAKELLCRMYAIDRHSVNYTALLLAFCKHHDPREGFGKALSLALGNRVCTDVEEGERYVRELYERKRLGLSLREICYGDAFEVTRGIIDQLMKRVTVEDLEEEGEERSEGSDYSSKVGFEDEREGISFTDSSTSVERRDRGIVYWLSLDVCITVLAATLPWHAIQSEITGRCSNFRECLSIVFKELRDESLYDRKNVALVHRFLDHDFVKRLLTSVGKFTSKNMSQAVEKLLRAKEQI